ncbi:ubiquitin-conjugating enzyme E2-22 kDa-like [Drosophila obscura]|uniref:ubiquitin-conjugating enzyme E2-22 kDa-like n=1 Tax=Drosophila obscura TaxID=7282 RepID=UPI001BB1CACD|nr:ubiquitin-conjugating enzyme E2-22 kDa-like [Drosophila obscura]XP_022226635.2 ubiquitin-conjugating enzyme E2-22 kDa-like [Drosophila obscura]XP_022226636.2 ubiquitin-conjugating enzyme E2-22 kDa-like [Drosophila obscura]
MWSNTGAARVQREINTAMHMRSVNGETAERGFKLWLIDESWSNLCAEIQGPPGSPYEGGVFVVRIIVPDTYPVEPPKVEFRTRIWHPNVSPESGAIELDILGKTWSPDMSIRSTLMAVKNFIAKPDMDTPYDEDVARQYILKQELFVLTAKHWTHRYASGPNSIPEFVAKIQALKDLGMYDSLALSILSKRDWDVEKVRSNFSLKKSQSGEDQA